MDPKPLMHNSRKACNIETNATDRTINTPATITTAAVAATVAVATESPRSALTSKEGIQNGK